MEKKLQHKNDYCWNTIGIWSDDQPSCQMLDELIHCRNCHVFQSGAKMLLAAKAPDGYLDEWTKILSGEKEVDEELSNPVFIFRIGSEWLALPASTVRHISRPSSIHSLPGKSDNILRGLVNIKGSIELCFSLDALIGTDAAQCKSQTTLFGQRFVGIGPEETPWVFAADEILDITRYKLSDTGPLPATVANARPCYVDSAFRYNNVTVGMLDSELITDFLERRLR